MIDLVAFIPRAVGQGIPLLYGSTGEIVTQKSGNLNLGIPGVMYVGAISGVIGSFLYEHSFDSPAQINGALAIIIPLVCWVVHALLITLILGWATSGATPKPEPKNVNPYSSGKDPREKK